MDKKYNVLIVDDDLNNVQLAVNILKQNKDYNIIFATSGKSALERVKEYDFDIIVLDILMEPMDGYEVCLELKNDDKTKDIPIIFLTAKNDEDSISKGFELGGVDYITKPFFEKEFISRVATHLELKSLRDKLVEEIEFKDKLMLKQNKMATMGEMIENIIHQWRQPLSSISTIASGLMIKKEYGIGSIGDKSELEYFQDILRNVNHLSRTIDDFKDFFKKRRIGKFNLKDTVNRSLNLMSKTISQKEVIVNNNIESIIIEGYENDLIQVIINIINNAIDVIDKNDVRVINIDSKIQDQYIVIISIIDNGGGVDSEIIDKIFDSHFTTKPEDKGTGIGLYMSKKIIKEHFKGELSVKNTIFKYNGTEYMGAKFSIKIPLEKKCTI